MDGAGDYEADPLPPPLDQLRIQRDAVAAATMVTRPEHHGGVSDAPTSFFRIENLPEEIQPLVMSLLPLKDAVRASVVSKDWRMLWTFHRHLFFGGTEQKETDHDSVRIKEAKFIETVNRVIQQHGGVGLNKFGIRFKLRQKDFDHLDRRIAFAAASKANAIDIHVVDSELLPETEDLYQFPLDALHAQGSSFVQSLHLFNVSVKPRPGIRGFTKLRSLVLDFVEILGDLSDLLLECPVLEDLQITGCGVSNLSMSHQLDKLQSLLIAGGKVKTVELHVANLAYFEYRGPVIPVVLHGCSKLEKASMLFKEVDNPLGHAFIAIPSFIRVKILIVNARSLLF